MKLLRMLLLYPYYYFLCCRFCNLLYFIIIHRNQSQKVQNHQAHKGQETERSNGSEMSAVSSLKCGNPECDETFDNYYDLMKHLEDAFYEDEELGINR